MVRRPGFWQLPDRFYEGPLHCFRSIFDRFDADELGIVPLKFEHSFFCTKCGGMATAKTCAHDAEYKIFLAGTKVRAMLKEGKLPPPEFTRPEIAKILMEAAKGGEQ